MPSRCLVIAALCIVSSGAVAFAGGDDVGLEFFEKQVRPILSSRCYQCHSGKAKRLEGKLRLDSLAAALKGGETGPALVPGKPKESLLVDAINYGELYQMPPKTPLPATEIAILTKWVEIGAPWPKEDMASSAATKEFNLQERRASHWCWQPITRPSVPEIRNPIDAFILAKLREKGFSPAPPADRRTLVRRLYFDLIGLPPTPEEVEAFVTVSSPSLPLSLSPSSADSEKKALETVVDRLLASPHFGERWGRHWLDLVRYAESRGHEFDPNIPNAFEYRDYVIRALNADVPYDQFVIEHVAGDLLDKPRLHPKEGYNESIVGTGFWFLGEWIHSPVDIRKDECDRLDNQIDVFSKTFLGLTVSCARCHDHKFDAISQRDYYALAGFLQSSCYRLTRFATWNQDRALAAEFDAVEQKYRPRVATAVAALLRPKLDELARSLSDNLDKLQTELGVDDVATVGCQTIVDYANPAAGAWMTDGQAFGIGPVRAGTLLFDNRDGQAFLDVVTTGAARNRGAWNAIHPAPQSEGDQGRLSGWLRAGRTLKTPTFTVKSGQVHYLVEGAGHVYAAVDSHALLNGPLHGELAKETGGNSDLPSRWITHDLSRYVGHRVHLEFSPKEGEDFYVLQVVEGSERPKPPARRTNVLLERIAQQAGGAAVRLQTCRDLLTECVDSLSADRLVQADQPRDRAAIVNWLLIESKVAANPPEALGALLINYRGARNELAAKVQRESRLCLAMWDGTPVDENLLIRGNHKTAGPAVPRRLLEAMASGGREPPGNDVPRKDVATIGSGRLELARQLVDPSNPFTSRVLVNRVWHHLLGRGIVPSVDNFGVLGQEPTHPELLDHLALEFMRDGWSLKRLIRSIVLSDTYCQASGASVLPLPLLGEGRGEGAERAESADPQNLLFHRQNLKRLEGEAIRDAILAISGRLDPAQFGPSVPVHLTAFMQGRGRPGTSGPVDGSGRRSIYISVRRNFLSPMMLAFDTPIPFSTVGRRNVSNVPAQALILMNDPFVAEQSRVWAGRLLADKSLANPKARIRRMYLQAFSREPTSDETAAALAFVGQQAVEYGLPPDAMTDERVWADLGHVLLNVKEFVLVN